MHADNIMQKAQLQFKWSNLTCRYDTVDTYSFHNIHAFLQRYLESCEHKFIMTYNQLNVNYVSTEWVCHGEDHNQVKAILLS